MVQRVVGDAPLTCPVWAQYPKRATCDQRRCFIGMNCASLGPALTLILITVVALVESAPLWGARRRVKAGRIRRLVLRCCSIVSDVRRETRSWHEAEAGVRVEKAGYSFCGGILHGSG